MDPEENIFEQLFGSTSTTAQPTEIDPNAIDSAMTRGTMGELVDSIQSQPPSVQSALIKEKQKADQQRISDVNIVSDAERNVDLIDSLLETENYKWVGGETQNWLGKWGLASVVPGVTGFGDAQADIEKIKGSIFMSQIPQMRGLGALSNAEGSRIVEAVSAIASATPDADGNYKNAMSEDKIKTELEYLRDRFGKISKRLKSGQRVHPTEVDENGEPVVMSSEQFNNQFPELANEPAFVAGETQENPYNFKDQTPTQEELQSRINDFRSNAPEGSIFVLPDGKSYRKAKTTTENTGG